MVPAQEKSPSVGPTSGKPNGKPILIIEDEKPLAHALELKLNHEGFQTHVCLNGADGLKEALTEKYSLILLDLIMPELDGFTLLQHLNEKKIKTPVIILSNLGQEEDKEKAKTLGVVDYFVKANTPIVDIIKRVKSVIN